jgi:hypothetical protein
LSGLFQEAEMNDMDPGVVDTSAKLIGPAICAAAGVLVRHFDMARRGERKLFGIHLLYEAPTVAMMGILGGGLGAYLDLPELATWAVASVLGFYGVHALPAIVSAVAQKVGVKGIRPEGLAEAKVNNEIC